MNTGLLIMSKVNFLQLIHIFDLSDWDRNQYVKDLTKTKTKIAESTYLSEYVTTIEQVPNNCNLW